MSAQTMEELAERAEAAVADAMRIPPLDLCRSLLNEAGLPKARQVLRDGLGWLAAKQRDLRVAQEEERDAKAALDAALVASEWELDGWFVAEGNKTFLVTAACNDPAAHEAGVDSTLGIEGHTCVPERKAMTADERAKWKATEARKTPEVAAAAARLRSAEHDVAGCRDALVIAEKSLGAARADLDGAIAHLSALVTALPGRTNG